MWDEHDEHLFGIDEGCVPVLQTSSDESSTSEYMMGWMRRRGDRCGQ